MARAAVDLLLSRGAEYLIHCGDVGGTDVLDQLAGHPAMFVFGNNDWDARELQRYATDLGIACRENFGKLSLGGKLMVITHGDNGQLVQRVLTDQLVDYMFLGHSHQTMDQRQGRVRIINPGALYRASVKTVALLNTQTDALEFLTVREPTIRSRSGF
jgi:uncharacterized protein